MLGVVAALPVPDPVDVKDEESDCEPLAACKAVCDTLAVSVALSEPGWLPVVGETLSLESWDGVAVRVRPPETVCDSEGFCETDPVSVKDAVPVVEELNNCAWLMVVVTELVNI